MLLAERAGRKLEPWSNSRPRGMAVITGQPVVTESGLSAYFISSFMFAAWRSCQPQLLSICILNLIRMTA